MLIISAGLPRQQAGWRRASNYHIVFTKSLCTPSFVLCLNFKSLLDSHSISRSCLVNYLRDCPVVATNHEQELEKVKHQPKVSCSPLLSMLCTGRSSSWLAAHQVSRRAGRLQPTAQHRSLGLSPCQSRCTDLSSPIVQRRPLPANRAAQVSHRQSGRADAQVSCRQHRAGLSPPIAQRRSLPANRAVQVSPR